MLRMRRSLWRADHSCRGVLTGVCLKLRVIWKPKQWGGLGPSWDLAPQKKKWIEVFVAIRVTSNTVLLYLVAYDAAYTLKMETAKASETSVTVYQTITPFTPEDLKVQYRLNAMKIINRILCQIQMLRHLWDKTSHSYSHTYPYLTITRNRVFIFSHMHPDQKLTAHVFLVPRSRMCGIIPPHPHTFPLRMSN
jgi:hypothetical protein